MSHLRNLVAHQESGTAAETVAFRAVLFGVAQFAVDVAIGTIAGQDRIQDAMAFAAIEAALVPHSSAGQHLLSGKNSATAARTTLSFRRLNGRRAHVARADLVHITSRR
jgi:hypothetical protein